MRFAVVIFALLLSACQTLSGLEKPEVSLSSVQLEQVSVFEQQWHLVLRVRNPNDRELTLNSLDYEVFFNGERFARGLTGERVILPAMGDALVSTRITTTLLGTLQQLQGLQRLDEPLDYEIKGKARVAGVGFPLHFDRKGQFTLPDTLPRAR